MEATRPRILLAGINTILIGEICNLMEQFTQLPQLHTSKQLNNHKPLNYEHVQYNRQHTNTITLTYFPAGKPYKIWYREQLGFRLWVTLFNIPRKQETPTNSTYSMIYTHVLQLDNKIFAHSKLVNGQCHLQSCMI